LLLNFYLDESYNEKTFILGGFIGSEKDWKKLEEKWKRRVVLERRRHKTFERFHATSCNGKTGDYAGWSSAETTAHVKAFLRIIKQCKIYAVCSGIDMDALKAEYPDENDHIASAYDLALRQCMIMTVREVLGTPEKYEVAIIHDWANKYNAILSSAFSKMVEDQRFEYRNIFKTIAALHWFDSACLQPADLIAFDTFKLLAATLRCTTPKMRKSLEALLGGGTPVKARYINRSTLVKLKALQKEATECGIES
jgi:hypothetical protein